ncbi:helix-turn-helix transcriptional regulator [Acinetobacter sp. 187]|uniref:XRE family transcriptional regulator n=1 Tax=Acinetobacter lanii TaxID=2715163 RepID=UPI00140952E4|nr:S24 family peptidase [Acinetobacter lanii]NHC02360.1 helix-turn-helix transcriptional regulator [Acinetobacter lanii]
MKTLGERLKKARRDARLSQQQVADAVGIKQPTYQSLESGKNLKSAYIPQIADLLNVDTNWLLTGSGSNETDDLVRKIVEKAHNSLLNDPNNNEGRVSVNLVNIKFNKDESGQITFDYSEVIDQVSFKNSFFEKHGVDPKNVITAESTDDAQSPHINSGDIFAIDLSDTVVKDGGFYVIYFEGEILLKKIFKEQGNILSLESLNDKYRAKKIDATDQTSFRVIGRQFWRAG